MLDGVPCDANPTNKLLDNWLTTVTNLAYDADDLLDLYAIEGLRRRLDAGTVPPSKTRVSMGFRLKMAHKVRDLMVAIDDAYKEAQRLGMRPVKLVEEVNNGGASSSSLSIDFKNLQVLREIVDEQGLVGREDDEDELVRMVCDPRNNDRDLSVVGIVGMGGVGKTSLCKRVFSNARVKDYYPERVWVTVSHDFDLIGLLNKIVEYLFEETSNMSNCVALTRKIQSRMRKGRYLLVLDDVWDTMTDLWETLRNVLNCGSKGNMILATSRDCQALRAMKTDSSDQGPVLYGVKVLTASDGLMLFNRRLGERIADENIAREMVKKCGGVPLAIKVLGDLLRSKSVDEWREIEESELWSFRDKYGILPSLQISFNYLPNAAIKRCFGYCAVFPEDTEIVKEQLIQLWMAQGYLEPYDKMESVGDLYFNTLLNHSFFQDVEFDEWGNVCRCKMHDAVRVLAQVVSRQDCLFLGKNSELKCTSTVRHLLLDSRQSLAPEFMKKLRSLLMSFRAVRILENILTHAKHLRVLSIPDLHLQELPDSISNLKHLKYLDISDTPIQKLPGTITSLYNLQTLRSSCRELPNGICNLVNLRHIHLPVFRSLVVPEGLGQLKCLQTLPLLHLARQCGQRITELGPLNNLKGSLDISGLEHVGCGVSTKNANLGFKQDISVLKFHWGSSHATDNVSDVLEGLQPHQNLKALEVSGFRGKNFPQWLVEMTAFGGTPLHNLIKIELMCCRVIELPWSSLTVKKLASLKELTITDCHRLISLPDLGHLTSLQVLTIENCKRLTCIAPKGSFENCSSLTAIDVRRCRELSSLVSLDGLTSLHSLSIERCKKLACISPTGSFQGCLSLKVLEICWCPSLTSIGILDGLTSLRRIKVHACQSLVSFSDLQGLESLRDLEITECKNLTCISPGGFRGYTSLKEMRILLKIFSVVYIK